MSQQINLFTPAFVKQKKLFSTLHMVQGLGMLFLGAIGVTGYAGLQLSRLTESSIATTTQLQTAKVELATLDSSYPPRQKSKALEQEIQKLEMELRAQKYAADILQKGELGSKTGYSDYMRAFSLQRVEGLWLTGFSVSGSGSDIQLHGRALQPDLVPLYIGRLKQEAIMQGKSFEMLQMQVPQVEAGNISANTASGMTKPRLFEKYISFSLQSSIAAKTDQSGQKVFQTLPSGGSK